MGEKPYTPFISIVIPAHNEEKYLPETLTHLGKVTYPTDSYEIIVVENGSTDDTLKKARAFESKNLKVLNFAIAGAAYARNRGIEAVSPKADWIMLLDADSHFSVMYLHELAERLSTLPMRCVVGTTSVLPYPDTKKGRAWFAFYDFFHKHLGQSFASVLIRRSALTGERFEEGRTWMEDVGFVETLKQKGVFFFITTTSVFTSTRRYEKEGWWRLFFWQIVVGILPSFLSRKFDYAPVR